MKNTMALGLAKNMIFCSLVLLPFQLDTNVGLNSNYKKQSEESVTKVVILDLKEKYCDAKCYLNKKQKTIEFMSNTFGVKSEKIKNDLIEINKDGNYDISNIGRLKNKKGELQSYDSFEKGLIEYLIWYCKNNPKEVNNTRIKYTGDAEYVENLIKYFTSIYDNVDTNLALSIGAAESGYYKVKYMLSSNNIYGGMGKNGLIKYKNIEYGVLSYIRLLSDNYFGKGLNSVESIGRVYCPITDANGKKVASSHWVKLVKTAMKHYEDDTDIVTLEILKND